MRRHCLLFGGAIQLIAASLAGCAYIGGGTTVVSLSAGRGTTCALTTSGTVKCWGDNSSGQLGDGTTTDRTTPVDVVGLDTGVTMVSAGGHHTCALTTSGTVSCWGDNSSGQLGDGTTRDRTTPVDVVGLAPDVTMVTAGNDHTCAVTSSGTVKCWGDTVDEATPFDVDWLGSDVTMVSAGNDRTCALTTSGAVKCWGYNVHGGHLADGALDSGVSVVSAGFDHTCAVTSSSGAVTCWGYNSKGQLGDGTTMDRVSFTGVTPVNVVGLGSDVTMVSAGDEHTCALTTSGTAQCWGDAFWGQLGDGTTTNRLTPVDVVGLGSDVTMVSAGGDHTCAVTSSGTAKCWGSNFEGQLGDGTTTDRSIPVDVEWLTPAQALLRLLGAFVLILLVTTPVMLLVKRLRGARRIKRAIEDLGEGSPIERQAAARTLGWIGTDLAVEPLVTALHDPDANVHEAALESLIRLRYCRPSSVGEHQCPNCGGSGRVSYYEETGEVTHDGCTFCEGYGAVSEPSGTGGIAGCPYGSRVKVWESHVCSLCGGEGRFACPDG